MEQKLQQKLSYRTSHILVTHRFDQKFNTTFCLNLQIPLKNIIHKSPLKRHDRLTKVLTLQNCSMHYHHLCLYKYKHKGVAYFTENLITFGPYGSIIRTRFLCYGSNGYCHDGFMLVSSQRRDPCPKAPKAGHLHCRR